MLITPDYYQIMNITILLLNNEMDVSIKSDIAA